MQVVEPSEAAQWGLGLRETPDKKDGIVINLDGAGRPVTSPDAPPNAQTQKDQHYERAGL